MGRRQAVWHFAYSSDGLQRTIHVFLRLEQTPHTRVATLGRLQYPHTQSATPPGVHLTSTSRDVCSQSDFSMLPSHAYSARHVNARGEGLEPRLRVYSSSAFRNASSACSSSNTHSVIIAPILLGRGGEGTNIGGQSPPCPPLPPPLHSLS